MWICIVFIALGVVGLVFYLLEKCKNYSLKGVLIKTIISLLFLAVALSASYLNRDHALNAFVIFGLILGLLGDIWLDLKYVYPKEDKIYTYAGFIAFGIGHILFVTGMMMEYFGGGNFLFFLIPLGAAVLFSIANYFLAKPMKLDFKDMKFTVSIYAFLLAMTPFTALFLCIYTGWSVSALIMLFAGGISFAISDLVLSGTYFGEGHEKPLDFILNYIFYYGAQFTIAFSIYFL